MPYPALLIATEADGISLSLGHKRFAQNEAGKVVVEDLRKTGPLSLDGTKSEETAFLATLALASLPSRNMFALYQGWIDCVLALEAARITGTYASPSTAGKSVAIRDALDTHAHLTRELILLRTQAEKEKQMNCRVELNLEIKRIMGELAAITNMLKVEGTQ